MVCSLVIALPGQQHIGIAEKHAVARHGRGLARMQGNCFTPHALVTKCSAGQLRNDVVFPAQRGLLTGVLTGLLTGLHIGHSRKENLK